MSVGVVCMCIMYVRTWCERRCLGSVSLSPLIPFNSGTSPRTSSLAFKLFFTVNRHQTPLPLVLALMAEGRFASLIFLPWQPEIRPGERKKNAP